MRKHLVNVSPLILASACGLLVIIIGSFALNNYSREKRLMEMALFQKGEAVLKSIDSGIRVSLRGHLMGLSSGRYKWVEHVQEVIDQVERIYLERVLSKTKGRINQAARIAGIHSRGLYNKMKRLGLRKEDFKS